MAERADWPCPATGLDHCPDHCNTACLRLGDESCWPAEHFDELDLANTPPPLVVEP